MKELRVSNSAPIRHRRSEPRRVRQSVDAHTRQADRVYAALKDELYVAPWALPDGRLTENGLSDHFGTSRAPVREALQRMVQERYLSAHFRNGYTVRAFSMETFRELSEVRILLESQALRWASADPRVDHRSRLALLRASWDTVDRESDLSRINRLNTEFHCGLVALSSNAQLMRLHNDVFERVEVIQRLDFIEQYRIESTYDEHCVVLDALESGDYDKAVEHLESHIRRSTECVGEHIRANLQHA